ncbi:MAG: lamin tail domain-containing protein [Verrucomicrobiales bacterium]|nr:lamin tail domain-containing protein [Verrucomicrobiales bacterium]
MRPFRLLLALCLASFGSLASPSAVVDLIRLISADVGSPGSPGSTRISGPVIEMNTGSGGIGPRLDQFHFASTPDTNDFDVSFCVTRLDPTDVLARAGLMVRDSLDSNAPFVGVFTSPTAVGTHLLHRTSPGSIPIQTGLYPPNLPQAWLRLRRQGDLYTAFAGTDGIHWTLLGSVTQVMAAPLVGFAGSSGTSDRSSMTVFQQITETSSNAQTVPFAPEIEPPGPSSRRSAIVVSEIMYHPPPRPDGRNGEFVELYNSQPFPEDISGWKVGGDYDFTFPPGTVIAGGGFLIVAPSPGDVSAIHGISNAYGGFTNSLSRGSGTIRILSDRGAVFFETSYRDKPPWPLAADGSGHSLALVRPSLGEADPNAWAASSRPGGSPGAWEGVDGAPHRRIRINEILARSVPGGPSPFLELYNPSPSTIELSGFRLGYSAPAPGYVFPPDSRIEGGGFLSIPAEALGFLIRLDAETLLLREPEDFPDGGAVVDAVRFEPASPGVSRGRVPDGSAELHALSLPTPDKSNGPARAAEVVINEIFYRPLSGDEDLQFIELHNPGSFGVSLGNWRLNDGIRYTFPSGTFIAPGGFLVVARDATRLRAAHPGLTTANCIGNFDGRLSGRGERIVLERPETVPASGGLPERTLFAPVDEVSYRTGGQWGSWSDGGGSSLELTDPHADRRWGANWADSDESARGRWVTLESTGILDLGGDAADSLHVGLMGEGECLLDNLEVIGPGGTNLIANWDFEESVTNYVALGNHIRSGFEANEGDASSRSLHLRASGNMDTGANRIRFRLARAIPPGETATLRARLRWLKGWPEPLLRLHGNWLEAIGRLDFPEVGGTPGAPNSRRVANAGPALADLRQAPVLPAENEPVRVSIRATDPDGIDSVTLQWRVDPGGDLQSLPMKDDGAGGDEFPGDGVFSAMIPGQAGNTLVAFSVSAQDQNSTFAQASFPPAGGECLVRFGEAPVANAFGTYRLWLTRTNVTRWSGRPNLSNEPIPGTLVYGNFRAIHGAGYRFAGSPYHQQFSSPTSDCHYVWRLPGDDRLLGSDNFNKVHAPGNGPFDDDTIQREQTIYWMGRQIGLPWLYRRYVNVVVNGSKRRRLMEDTQVPGGDLMESYFPADSDGDLFKINPWFEFAAGTGTSLGFSNQSWADLNDYRTTGNIRKVTRYRWNWQPRAAHGTVNNYTNLFALIDAANSPGDEDFVRGMEAQADMDEWLKTFALNHAAGNWDSFGNRNAQNMYAYRPKSGRWQLFMWDANIVFGNSGSDGPRGDDLFQYNFSDGPMGRIYNTPKFRRAYLRHLKAIAEGPMQPGPVGALIDSKFAAFQSAGLSASPGTTIKSWLRNRVTYLQSEVAKVSAPFTARVDGVDGGSTSQNLIQLVGTAPLGVEAISVNGVVQPVVWTSDTEWRVTVLLSPGSNRLTVTGRDAMGNLVAGSVKLVTIRFTGSGELPSEKLAFGEILYQPKVPGAEFVELVNGSVQNAFDVSGWRVDGLGYVFPNGTLLAPGARWVITRDPEAFRKAFDSVRATFHGIFPGSLSPDGEALRLVRPGIPPAQDDVITGVHYSPHSPWPTIAPSSGSSLQLMDGTRSEDERVGNWAVIPPLDPDRREWRQASVTGITGTDGTLQLYLSSVPPVVDPLDPSGLFFGGIRFGASLFPGGVRLERIGGVLTMAFVFDATNPDVANPLTDVTWEAPNLRFGFDGQNRFVGQLSEDGNRITGRYLTAGGGSSPFSFDRINPGGDVLVDDVTLVQGTVAEAGPNLLSNGGFEDSLQENWKPTGSHGASDRTESDAHSGRFALRLKSETGGDGTSGNSVIQLVTGWGPGTEATLSLWYRTTTNGLAIVARTGDGAIQLTARPTPTRDPHLESTPGFPNSSESPQEPFPDLWLNEVLPDPVSGTPFAELYNHGTNAINLGGLFLGTQPEDAAVDSFPPDQILAPGGFLRIALDGAGALSDTPEPRTSFRPRVSDGMLLLSRISGRQTNILDFLHWGAPGRGNSFGHYPDGSPFDDRIFATPTPGSSNSLIVPVRPLVINEWMALNSILADPAGGAANQEFDDWFELYNPGSASVSLDGFILSNSVSDNTKFRIPPGYSVPARGFLLVWADNQSRQNSPASPDLHVNFKLSGSGEAIALFAPDGTLVDSVEFGPQERNVSEGRATHGGPEEFVRFPNPTPGRSNVPVPPPILSEPEVTADGRVTLRWSATPGATYQVRSTEALEGPWALHGDPVKAVTGIIEWQDPVPSTESRYYLIEAVN